MPHKLVPLFLTAFYMRRNSRKGEGPLSDTIEITIGEGSMGEALASIVPEHTGRNLKLTPSEQKTFKAVLTAADAGSVEPLRDFVEQFPR